MKRIINGFEVDWASERVFAEQQTAPNYGYLFEVSANRKLIVRCAHSSAIGGDSDKAMPAHLFSYPYAGTYLRVDYAKRRFGYPYVGSYYGNYYAPAYAYSYVPPYGITTIPCTRVIRLQQHLLPLSPLFTLSLKRLTEVYLGPTG